MKIYDFEKRANIAEAILNNRSEVIASVIAPTDAKIVCAKKLNANIYPSTDCPSDVMEINGILVTTNANLNHDLFTKEEVWAARRTPLFKPVNRNHEGREEHKQNTTLGVIVNSYAIDDDYNDIYVEPEETSKLPDKYHLLVRTWVWEKYFPEAAAEIKANIDSNKQFMSMECFFNDFGYGLKKNGSDSVNLLPRNEITSWLSASLRSYGGRGEVDIDGENYTIYRWLKNLTFSGVAFVDRPANPESIVFSDYFSNAEEIIDKISKKAESSVLINSETKENIMSKETKVEAPVVANTEVLDLTEQVKTLEASINKLTADNSALVTDKDSVAAQNKVLSDALAKANDLIKEIEAKVKEQDEKMCKMAKRGKAMKRYEAMKKCKAHETLAENEDKALDVLENMDDSQFEILLKTVEGMAKLTEAMSSQPKLTEQTFSNQPKLTDQTFTNLPKLTEAVEQAKAEDNTSEAAAAAAANTNKNVDQAAESKAALETFVSQAISGKKPKTDKKVK